MADHPSSLRLLYLSTLLPLRVGYDLTKLKLDCNSLHLTLVQNGRHCKGTSKSVPTRIRRIY